MGSERNKFSGSMDINLSPVQELRVKKQRWLTGLLLLIFFGTGCGSYYVDTPPLDEYHEYIYELEHHDQYVLVHFEDRVMHLKDVRVSEDADLISGLIEIPDQAHESYKTSEKNKIHNYVPSVSDPTNEIHLFLGDDYWMEDGRFLTRYGNVREVHKYFKEPNQTMRSKVFWAGIVVSVILILVYYFGSNDD